MTAKAGKFVWFDLTVENAAEVRDFYQQVVGWSPDPVEMGDYQDFSMKADDGSVVAGICHKRGENQTLPSQWMIYISVDDLDKSLAAVTANGGKILVPTRGGGGSRFTVIQDPGGAVCTLFEQKDA
ncbi:MAG: VOC family protein [Anaerolinea sp.]|nr:VOC family protein [Anaerolinea sp.]